MTININNSRIDGTKNQIVSNTSHTRKRADIRLKAK